MSNNIYIIKLREQNDAMLEKIMTQLGDIKEDIYEMNTHLYDTKIDEMGEEDLKSEFYDRTSSGCENEYNILVDKYGVEFVREYLKDQYGASSYERLMK